MGLEEEGGTREEEEEEGRIEEEEEVEEEGMGRFFRRKPKWMLPLTTLASASPSP